MNIRLTILLAVLAVMIGATWAIIEFTDVVFRGEPDPDEPWLYKIQDSDITNIEVEHQGEAVRFARDPGGYQWMIIGEENYPVFQQRWGGTPLLLSGPRVNRGLKETLDNPAQYGLDPPETVVRVSDYAGNTYEFHMGIPTPDGSNQYARLVGDNALYTVPAVWAQVVNRLAMEPPWGKLFDLDIAAMRVIEVTVGEDSAIYFLEEGSWRISTEPPPVNPETAAPVSEEWNEWLRLLAAPRIDTVVDPQVQDRETERLEEYGLLEPAIRVVIARTGQATVEIHLSEGPAGSDSYYARTVNNIDEKLYSIRKERLAGIEGLATDPLILPGWEGPAMEEDSESEDAGEGDSSN